MFALVPLGPSIRSLLLDVLEHVFMLHLNLNAHVQFKTNLYAFCYSTLPQLFQWGKEELRNIMRTINSF
ncbi:hypothetical protein BpHYR1_005607 [Brachionus plicatilis]|uniref:Uncharacterized protein n=1 Tax=Brachionus plicatilis TaxID=10195 RepID=A0A3M7PY10_BRAPC|nr:hypothetical protein BpHYR1_005607 [Brachionus plicatilis]